MANTAKDSLKKALEKVSASEWEEIRSLYPSQGTLRFRSPQLRERMSEPDRDLFGRVLEAQGLSELEQKEYLRQEGAATSLPTKPLRRGMLRPRITRPVTTAFGRR